MNCEAAKKEFSLYLYGELGSAEEEAMEQHLAGCTTCSGELEQERRMHQAMDVHEWQPSMELLHASRRELRSRMAQNHRVSPSGIMERLKRLLHGPWGSIGVLRPIGALALLGVGFFGGRLWDATKRMSEPSTVRVRNLTPNAQGGVQLVLEEVRQKTLTGRLDDEKIRAMLLAAASDPNDPGLRGRSLEALQQRGEEGEVRRVLLQALERDSNAGVRLKAIDGLRRFAVDPETQRVLSNVLLEDDNPGVRTRAIDLLVENMQAGSIGTLQELIIRESNPYIRQKSLKALRAANASVETF